MHQCTHHWSPPTCDLVEQGNHLDLLPGVVGDFPLADHDHFSGEQAVILPVQIVTQSRMINTWWVWGLPVLHPHSWILKPKTLAAILVRRDDRWR